MAELTLTTKKMKDCGIDFMNLSIELNEALNSLFMELENLEKNNVWVGNAAQSFIENIKTTKVDYYDLKQSLYNFGEFLEKSSERYETLLEEEKR